MKSVDCLVHLYPLQPAEERRSHLIDTGHGPKGCWTEKVSDYNICFYSEKYNPISEGLEGHGGSPHQFE